MVDVPSCIITDKTRLVGVRWTRDNNITRLYIVHDANCSLEDCSSPAAYINFSLMKNTEQQIYIDSVTVSCLEKSHVIDGSHPVPLCASGRKLAEKKWPLPPEYTCWTFATNHAGTTAYCPAHFLKRQMSMVSNRAMYKNKPWTNKDHESNSRKILPDTTVSGVHDNQPYHDMFDQFKCAPQPSMDSSELPGYDRYDPYHNTLNRLYSRTKPRLPT
jgi:hypothetical protein